jgi:hypothetical protein
LEKLEKKEINNTPYIIVCVKEYVKEYVSIFKVLGNKQVISDLVIDITPKG